MYEKDGYLNAEINFENFIYHTADTTKNDIEVIWKNEKDSTDNYTVKYDLNENSYLNLIDKIKDRILLVIKIDENQKVKVRHIVFEGNKAFSDDKLKRQWIILKKPNGGNSGAAQNLTLKNLKMIKKLL